MQVLHAAGEKTTGARRGVIDGPHHPRSRQGLVIGRKHQRGGQPHDVTGGKVLTGGLVGALGKLADQLLEHQTHVVVVDGLGGEIDVGEVADNLVKQVGIFQQIDAGGEVEVLEHLECLTGKAPHIGIQVVANLLLAKVVEGELGGVVEALPSGIEQQLMAGQLGHGLGALCGGQHLVTGRGQHALKTT